MSVPMELENFNLETSRNYSNLDQCLNESLALLSTRTGQKRKALNDQYKALTKDLVPITFGRLNVSRGKPTLKDVRILLDSSSSSTVMCTKLAKKLKIKQVPSVQWTTMAGSVQTGQKAKAPFSLPE